MNNSHLKQLLEYVDNKDSVAKVNSFRGNIFYFGAESNFNSLKKDGLGTPRYNYDHKRDLFMNTTYKIYKEKVQNELGYEPTALDIIHHIDTNPIISSRSQIFSFIPLDMYNDVYFNKKNNIKGGLWNNSKTKLVEITIPISKIKKHDPVVAGPGDKIGYSSWRKVSSIDFLVNVSNFCKKENKLKYKMNYDNFPHLWLHSYHIPSNNFSRIKLIKR